MQILAAFKKVSAQFSDYELLLVGGFYCKKFESEVRGFIADNQLADKVSIKTEVGYDQINHELLESRIGYVTYLTYDIHKTTLPNKLYEYLGAGLAIIASDFDNYRPVFVPDRTAILVEPESVDDLVEATVRCISDAETTQSMAARARKSFEEIYHWETAKPELIAAYRSILGLQPESCTLAAE